MVHHYYYWIFHVDAHGKGVYEDELEKCMLSNYFNIHNMDIKKNTCYFVFSYLCNWVGERSEIVRLERGMNNKYI
jgi:hypothetical protein